jgi:hypothetical protein
VTFRERIEAFPEPHRTQMLENASEEVLASKDNDHTDAGIVASAFKWDDSPEMYDYWRSFYRELDKKEKPL